MNKKQIALALAGALGVAPAAMAQSNVQIYGIVDAFLSWAKAGDNIRRGIDSGGLYGSRLGFRGSEDLGGGLKAVFTLEYPIEVDQNQGIGTSSALRSRQSFVGLESRYGLLSLGRQYAPGYAIARYDAAGGVPFGPQAILASGAGATIVPASPARWDNAIAYRSPNFGGVVANAIYSYGETNQNNNRDANDRWALSGDYANGPLAVGLLYQRGRELTTIGGEDQKEWGLGAIYDFRVVSLYGTYQTIKIHDTDKVWHLGFRVPVGASYLFAAYGRHDADDSDKSAKAGTIGYRYVLSKRTSLYGAYTRVNNGDKQRDPNIRPNGVTTNFGDDATGVFLGIDHIF
ncbi:porin [Aromatoleum toluclasticum]|uniref:porin n=1 Tax=Aromatoleum toluclasticum TaxID=92003 RepID=UPI001D18BBDE|nr:porin [Aromatoleum toluclasticum]MCC4114941.1 porin [Aromatoleum toluclasticum]